MRFGIGVLGLCSISAQFTDVPLWYEDLEYQSADLTIGDTTFEGRRVLVDGKEIEFFRGIRYGEADRFAHSVRAALPGGRVDTTLAAPSCFQIFATEQDSFENLQKLFDSNAISEDCLTLDIYRPVDAENAAILFWIHGGGYVNGQSKQYDGFEQAMKGNIVVSIQYRLALFGFMNLFDVTSGRTVGGNYGLRDQQLALEFIHEHAAAIGGNADKITISGESAGAMSVALHLHSPESRKHVFAAVAFSGSTTNAFLFNSFQSSMGTNFAWHQACNISDQCAIIENYSGAVEDTEKYIEALSTLPPVALWSLVSFGGQFPAFWGAIPNDGIFLTEDPRNTIYGSQNFRPDIYGTTVASDIPYFIATNSFEGSLYQTAVEEFTFDKLEQEFTLFLGNFVGDQYENFDQLVSEYFDEYNKNPSATLSEASREQNFTLATFIYGDELIREAALEEAVAYSSAGAATYVMYLDMDTEIDVGPPIRQSCCGVAHGSDLLYTFNFLTYYTDEPGVLVWEEEVRQFMSNEISTILNTGKPLADWPAFDSDRVQLVLQNNATNLLLSEEAFQLPKASQKASDYWNGLAPADDPTDDSTDESSATFLYAYISLYYLCSVLLL